MSAASTGEFCTLPAKTQLALQPAEHASRCGALHLAANLSFQPQLSML